MVMSFDEFVRSRGIHLPFGNPTPALTPAMLPPDFSSSLSGQPQAPLIQEGPIPIRPLPQQSTGERNRFLEQNLPPGQDTFSGQVALAQALFSPHNDPALPNIGTNPFMTVATAQAIPQAFAEQKAAAAQQDIARIGQQPTAPQISSFMEITPELMPYLSPGTQAFVMEYQDAFAKAKAEDPTFAEIPDEYHLGVINRDLQRRFGMDAQALAADNAALAQQEGTPANIAFAPIETIGNAMDAPRKWSVRRAGEDGILIAQGKQQSDIGRFLTWFPGKTEYEAWVRDPKNHPFILNAAQNGYTAENGATFSGGDAVWELFINSQDRWHRTVYDLAYDPLTYLPILKSAGEGIEAVGAGTRALGETGDLGKILSGVLKGAGSAAEITGKAATIPDVVLNQAADDLIGGGLGLAKDAVSDVPILGHLTRLNAESLKNAAGRRTRDAHVDAHAQQALPQDVVPEVTQAFPVGPISPPPPLQGPAQLPGQLPDQNLDPARMLPEPTLGPAAPAIAEPIALPGPKPGPLGIPLTPQELETYAPQAALPNPVLPEPVTPQESQIPVRTGRKGGFTYVGERNDYRLTELSGDRVRIDRRADNGSYPQSKQYQTIINGSMDDGIAEAKRLITGDVPSIGTATPELPSQAALPDPVTAEPVSLPQTAQAKPTVDSEGLAAQPVAGSGLVNRTTSIPGEPPIEPGYTRLYRGEALPGQVDTRPTWKQEVERNSGKDAARGRWWTDDRVIAGDYVDRNKWNTTGRLVYVDVPTADIDTYRLRNIEPHPLIDAEGNPVLRTDTGQPVMMNPKAMAFQDPQSLEHEFFLPWEIANTKQGMPVSVPRRVTEEPGTPVPQGRNTPKVGWSVEPNPAAQGIKDVLPADQWQKIRGRIEDWAVNTYEPFMKSTADKTDKVLAEAAYIMRLRQAAEDEGIDLPKTFKGSLDWTAPDKARTAPAKLYRVIHDVPPLNAEERSLLDEVKATDPITRTPEEQAIIGELDPTLNDRKALYRAGVLRKEAPTPITAAKGTPDYAKQLASYQKELKGYQRYQRLQDLWKALHPGENINTATPMNGATATDAAKAVTGQGPNAANVIADMARWFFLDENPITGATRNAITQPDPFPNVSGDVRNVLNEVFEEGHPDFAGMRVGDVGNVLTDEARADQAEVRRLVAGGTQPVTPEKRAPKGGKITTSKKVSRYDASGAKLTVTTPVERTAANPGERLAELRRKWAGFGDIENDDLTKMVANRLGHERKRAIDPRATRQLPLLADLFVSAVYRLPRHELLANPALSWAYSMRNMISNTTGSALLLKGQGISPLKALAGRDIYRGFKDIELSAGARLEKELGVAGGLSSELVDNDVRRVGGRATTNDVVSIGMDTRMRELSRKLRITEPIANAYDWKRGVDHRIEAAMKIGGAYTPMLRAFVAEEIEPLAANLAGMARNNGLPFTEEAISRDLWGLRGPEGAFSPHEVYDLLFKRAKSAEASDAIARRYAKTGSERWLGAARNARQKAIDATNRAFPGRNMTNADKYLSYVTLFHMWPTRTGKFVLEEMIRDPRIIMWWQRAHEGLDKMAEDEHYPASARGLIKLAMSPLGMQLFANPQALFMLNQLRPQGMEYPDPQGETELGHALKWLEQKSGLSPTPFFDALFNVVGVYGDDFLPDFIPSPTRQVVGASIDALMAYTGHGMGDPIYQQAMAKVRSIGSGIIPGTSNVAYVDPADKRNDPIASAVLLQNPDLAAALRGTDAKAQADAEAELAAIMDPDNNDPRLTEAEKAVAGINFFTTMVSRVFPLGIRSKNPVRESMIETAKAARDVPYDQRTPDQKAAVDARSIVTTNPDAMPYKAQQDQYSALGTPRQQALADGFNKIAYSTLAELGAGFVVVGGKMLTTRDLAGKSDAERKSLAEQWVMEQNGTKEFEAFRDTQKQFKDANVDYAQYSDWARQPDEYPGGIKAWRDDLMAISPSYKKYIKQLPKKTLDDPVLLDRASNDMNAFLASKGIKASIYGANLGSPGDSALVRMITNLSGGGGNKTSKSYSDTPEGRLASLKDKLGEYQTKMQIYNDAVKSVTGGAAIGNGPNDLSGVFAQPIVNQLKAKGIEEPSQPEIVRIYSQWVSAQPDGTDTSPEAFSAWFEQYKVGQSGTTGAVPSSALYSDTQPTTTASGRYYPQTYIPDARMGGYPPAR